MSGHGDEHAGHHLVPEPVHPSLEELHERKRLSRQDVTGDREIITVSMGPQHPSMHGVYQAVVDLDGEIIVATRPGIGNLHRGVEKLAEARTWHQVIPLTDRLDYLASFAMNHTYCDAVERLMGVEVPARAKYIRTIGDELCRLANHMLWLGVHIMDFGAQTFFLICFRDREYVLDLWEMLSGARLTHTFARIGGVAKDLPDGFVERCRKVADFLPQRLSEYERLIDVNRIFLKRAVGVGIFPVDDCHAWRVTGPALRAAGVARDLRKDEPYAAYDEIDFDVAVEYEADVYARYRVRMREMYESCRIIRQCLDNIPDGPYIANDAAHVLPRKKEVMRDAAAMVQDFVHVFHGPDAPVGEVYVAHEVPKGEMAVYAVSDGGPKPQRLRLSTPSFYHAQAVPPMFEGEMIADVVGIFGSLDVVLGDVDLMSDFIFLVIKVVLMIAVPMGMVVFIIYFERKFAGFFQSRMGPTYLGPWGSLQTVGDMFKLLSKENIVPDQADNIVYRLAPYMFFLPAFLTMALIPFGPMGVTIFGYQVDLVIANFDAALIMFLAIGSLAVYGVVFGGWASSNHWSLLGALRSGAQMISYELSMGIAIIGLIIMANTLSFVEIVDKQAGNFWNWYFIPQIVGFVIFFVASIAELNRSPFDLAEGEQELVGGYLTEYTGMRWGLYMFGEYVNMVLMSAVIATLFLGGWRAPLSSLNFIPGFIWLLGKVCFLVFIYMWIRWTVPRYRYNQLMDIGWKFFLPLAIANLAVTAVIVSLVS